MSEGNGPPLPLASPGSRDPGNSIFSIYTEEWLNHPPFPGVGEDKEKSQTPRPFFLDRYRQSADPAEWNHYVILGFFAVIDGQAFESQWRKDPDDWLTRHKIVWYNYIYHLDYHMAASPKLHIWATQLSQPYLQQFDPQSLTLDTTTTSWTQYFTATMDTEMDIENKWQTVGEKKTSKKVKYTTDTNMEPKGKPAVCIQPPKVRVTPAVTGPTSTLTKLKAKETSSKKKGQPASILRKSTQESTGTIKKPTLKPTRPPSALQAAAKQTTTHTGKPTFTPKAINSSVNSDDSNMKQSAFRPLLNVPTNDGTLRITIRWTPENKDLSHSKRQGEWLKAALEMLHELFCDDQGIFYRWESLDMATWTSPSDMTDGIIRDYISPNVTYAQQLSQGMFIFGVRFGFVTKTANSWYGMESTKSTMRQRKVWATMSNLSFNSGNLVNAGYILMKAPNTTHKVRYLQSLRNQLPENTPFFDIVLAKRTPLEQSINHLTIRCGENHVAPLTKVLSAILNGKGAAIFLPRVVLGKLSTEQITKYFVAHANYVKSL